MQNIKSLNINWLRFYSVILTSILFSLSSFSQTDSVFSVSDSLFVTSEEDSGNYSIINDRTFIKDNYISTGYCNNWENLIKKTNNPVNKTKILFLGDSHIQGGYAVNQLRNLFKEKGFKVSRGYTFPYRFARSYGPEDVIFRTSAHWNFINWSNKYQNLNSPFGSIVSTSDPLFDITITYKKTVTRYPFQKIYIFHSADTFVVKNEDIAKVEYHQKLQSDIYFTTVVLKYPVDSCQLNFELTGQHKKLDIHGVYLENPMDNLSVNSIGISGISFQKYNEVIELSPWLTFLKPDCIVLSLGTNDVYAGRSDTSKLHKSIVQIVRKIKQTVPGTAIILTTPNDHLIRRRYNNARLLVLNKIIKNVAMEENCAIWDFFGIMGGKIGSSREWRKKNLIRKDYIHLTKSGYQIQGTLLFEALENALHKSIQ